MLTLFSNYWVNMKNQILVGKILKPQGIKGEVKVKPMLDKLERFSSFKHFFVGREKVVFDVEKAYSAHGGAVSVCRVEPDAVLSGRA